MLHSEECYWITDTDDYRDYNWSQEAMIAMLYFAGNNGNHEYSPMDMPQWISEGITIIGSILADEKRAKEAELKWRAAKGF